MNEAYNLVMSIREEKKAIQKYQQAAGRYYDGPNMTYNEATINSKALDLAIEKLGQACEAKAAAAYEVI